MNTFSFNRLAFNYLFYLFMSSFLNFNLAKHSRSQSLFHLSVCELVGLPLLITCSNTSPKLEI